jgi:enediyne biosynthesis protein E4
LNNDGWQDVVMTYLGGHPQVFMNRGGKLHWLVISLRGTRSNRDGFGARVKVNGQTRFATSAGKLRFLKRQASSFWTGNSRKS